MFAERMRDCTQEEMDEFLEELAAPLNPEERRAEDNIDRWLRR